LGQWRIFDDHSRREQRLDRRRQGMMESLIDFRPARPDGLLTYFAPRAAERIRMR
jgi:delta-aminolevulinic acid dehydratase/porphobilinogen synthase